MTARVLLFCLLASPAVLAQRLHSYINERGIRVFTNIGVNRQDIQPPGPNPAAPRGESRYLPLIQQTASAQQMDANLVRAIVSVESAYDPNAVSSKGCVGLMQLHPDTARRFGVRNIYDPRENVKAGVRYLAFLMDLFERDLSKVLAAYNAGENAVSQYGGIPPFRETRNYVSKVLARYQALGPNYGPRGLQRVVKPDGSVLYTNLSAPSGR